MLFLHGGLGALREMAPLAAEFPKARCLLMDTRGHGASSPGQGRLTYQHLADDAAAVIAALGLDGGPGNYPVGIERIALPVLILNGDADELVSRQETVALAETIPGAALALIPYAGHMVHMEQSGLVAHAIRAMLDRLA